MPNQTKERVLSKGKHQSPQCGILVIIKCIMRPARKRSLLSNSVVTTVTAVPTMPTVKEGMCLSQRGPCYCFSDQTTVASEVIERWATNPPRVDTKLRALALYCIRKHFSRPAIEPPYSEEEDASLLSEAQEDTRQMGLLMQQAKDHLEEIGYEADCGLIAYSDELWDDWDLELPHPNNPLLPNVGLPSQNRYRLQN